MGEQVREINWFRSWPGAWFFSMLAVCLAVLAGAGVEAYAYSHWTPLERLYLRTYIESGAIRLSPLASEGVFNVLVTDPRHWAEQADVDAGSPVGWSTVRLRYAVWHEWLRTHIFGGNTAVGLLRPALCGLLVGLLVLLPFGAWLDIRRARR